MTLTRRLERLEASRPAGSPDDVIIEVDLDPEIMLRLEAAQQAGTFPASLSTPDLHAIIEALDRAGAHKHD